MNYCSPAVLGGAASSIAECKASDAFSMSLKNFAYFSLTVAPDANFVVRGDCNGEAIVVGDIAVPDPATMA